MIAELTGGLAAGVALGALYFAGLWGTVRRLPSAERPALLALGSYVGRLAALGTGLYLVVRFGGAGAVLSALVGFVAVRHVAIGRIAGEG